MAEVDKNEIMRRILTMVKDEDPMFMYLEDGVIQGFEIGGFITKISNENLDSTFLTEKGNEFLAMFN